MTNECMLHIWAIMILPTKLGAGIFVLFIACFFLVHEFEISLSLYFSVVLPAASSEDKKLYRMNHWDEYL